MVTFWITFGGHFGADGPSVIFTAGLGVIFTAGLGVTFTAGLIQDLIKPYKATTATATATLPSEAL